MVPATQAASRLTMNSKPSLEINVTWVEGVVAIVFWGGEDVGCGEMIGGHEGRPR